MRDQTTSVTPSPTTTQNRSGGTGQISVPASLLDAVMAVDEARDDGGLGLQEALMRMHEELTPFVLGQPAAPAQPERD